MPSGVLSSAMYNSAMRLTTCLLLALVIAGCRSRDVEKDLTITDVHTGWYDVGIVNGQNKLVPSISLKLKNVSPEQISRVQINAVFRRLDGENKEWDSHFVRGIGPDGLAPVRRATNWSCVPTVATPEVSRACRCFRTRRSSTPRSRSSASMARTCGSSWPSSKSTANSSRSNTNYAVGST